MTTDRVTLGQRYMHDETRTIMKCESASVPELNNFVRLVQQDDFAIQGFVGPTWRGTWDEFEKEWTQIMPEGEKP